MLKVLIVGQTPPPFGGQGIIIGRFVNAKLEGIELSHVRMGFSTEMNTVGRVRIGKILHMFAVIARIYYQRIFRGVRILYYPPGGPDRVSMYKDLLILLCTRWMFDKTILHFHAGGVSELYEELPRWQRWLFRRAFFRADAAIRLAEQNPEDGKRMEAKTEYIIPYGIDDPCPRIELPRPRENVTAARPLRILFTGIVRESKGILVLVEACGKLLAQGAPFRLEVMGQPHSDDFYAQLKQRITQLKLDDHVQFLGQVTGNARFAPYARADVFSMPTFFNCETFGIVFIEAMAHGLPVVATRWRGVPAVVDDEETGFVVEPHDADAVAERLARLAASPRLREQLGLAGREKFVREYLWPIYAERMRLAFFEIAGVEPPLSAESRKIEAVAQRVPAF